MRSLNTYNYREELYMKSMSYNVTISDDDKVIKIEDNGDLIVELSFALSNNTLFLNGKEGMEVAQIELPLAMREITSQKYNPETKSIDLSILQTNGETMTFSLDVAELVNVYTAGDGIDINDNVISLKIKDDSGILSVDEDGLDIHEESLASSDDIAIINNKLNNVNNNIVSLKEKDSELEQLINSNKDELNSLIENEKSERVSKDNELEEKINDFNLDIDDKINEIKDNFNEKLTKVDDDINSLYQQDEIEKTRAEEAEKLLDDKISTLNEKATELENKTASLENTDKFILDKIGDLGSEDANIADEIEKLKAKDEDILDKIGNLGSEDANIADEIEKLKAKDEDILSKIGDLGSEDANIADEIEKLKAKDGNLESEINNEIIDRINDSVKIKNSIDDEVNRAKNEEAKLSENIKKVDDKVNGKYNELGSMIANTNSSLSKESTERIKRDDELASLIAKEINDRKKEDIILDTKIENSKDDVTSSIKLVRDAENNLHYTLFVNDVNKGEINIPADKMLKSVTYDEDKKVLVFTWNASSQQEPTVINIADLSDEYYAGNGLKLDNLNGDKTFTIPLNKSNYILLNKNNQIDAQISVKRIEGSDWKYEVTDKNGVNHGNIIDFTAEHDKDVEDIKKKYATISSVKEDINGLRNEIIGNEKDDSTKNTLLGLRKNINEEVEKLNQSIASNKEEAVQQAALDATDKANKALEDSKKYTDGKFNESNDNLNDKVLELNQKDLDLAKDIAKNSTDIYQLSTGLGKEAYTGGTGLFDELHRLFHDLTYGLDEENMKGEISEIKNKVNELETKLNDVNQTIIDLSGNALKEAKEYTDKAKADAIDIAKNDASGKYQLKGDYALNSKFNDYVTRTELDSRNYADKDLLKTSLLPYLTIENASKTYQPIGEYLTEIPSDYVTENEVKLMGFANVEYVDSKTSKLLNKDVADSLYQEKGNYLTTDKLDTYGYATVGYVNEKTNDMLTKTEAKTLYQPIGNYLTEIPSEYITENELEAKRYVTTDELAGKNYATNEMLNLKTNGLLSKVEADSSYQEKGEYVTVAGLEAKRYVNEAQLNNATNDMATMTWVSSHYIMSGEKYITEENLLSRDYVSNDDLDKKQFVNKTTFNNTLENYLQKQVAEATYATKAELDGVKNGSLTANDIIADANGNIKVTKPVISGVTRVKLAVKLTDACNVEDIYNQNLPTSNDSLDVAIKKLSEGLNVLTDTTDGELFV